MLRSKNIPKPLEELILVRTNNKYDVYDYFDRDRFLFSFNSKRNVELNHTLYKDKTVYRVMECQHSILDGENIFTYLRVMKVHENV